MAREAEVDRTAVKEILKLAEKGFTAQEIAEHLEMPLEVVQTALDKGVPKAVSRALVENGLEAGFEELEKLALRTVEELLEQGKSTDRRELAVFVLKQRMGCFKAPTQTTNYNVLLQQFNERLSRGDQLAEKAISQLEAVDV